MLVIGIDPGSASGAVAWLHADGRAGVSDLPLIAGALDPHALHALLLDTPEPATAVFVEHVSAMPRQGVASTFKFGRAVGVALGPATMDHDRRRGATSHASEVDKDDRHQKPRSQ